jgi:Ca2+-binding EF-hand superfamily protein
MYFSQLDSDKSGQIDIEELEVPFISLNLCNSREQVRQAMTAIDKDNSGTIEFDEFLNLIKDASSSKAQVKRAYHQDRENIDMLRERKNEKD